MQNYQMYGQNNYQPGYPQQNYMNLNMMPNQQMPGNFPQAPAQSVSPSNSDENNEAKKIIFNRAPNIDQNGDGVKTSQGFFATYPYANFKDQPEVKNAIFYRLSANVENKDDDALLHAIYFLYFYFLFINSSQREHEKVLSFNKLKGKLSERVLEELKESEGKSYKVKDIKYYQNLFEKDKKVWTQDFFSDSLNEFFKKQPEKKEQKQSEFEKSYPQSDSLKNMPFILRRDIMILLKHKRNELDGIFTLRKSKQGQQGKRKVIVADVKDEQKFFIVFDMSFELKQGIKDEDFERKTSSDLKKEQVPKPQNDLAQNFQQMQQQNLMQPPNNNLSLAQLQGQNAHLGMASMQPQPIQQYQQHQPEMGMAQNMNQPSFPSLSQMQMNPQPFFYPNQNFMMNQNYQMPNFPQQQASIPYQFYNFNQQVQGQNQQYQKPQNSQTEANHQSRQESYVPGSGVMPDVMGQQLGQNPNLQQWEQNYLKMYQNSGIQNNNQPQPQPLNVNVMNQFAQPQLPIQGTNSSAQPQQQNIQKQQLFTSAPQLNSNQNMNENKNYPKVQEQFQEVKGINAKNTAPQASFNPMSPILPPSYQQQNNSSMFPQQNPSPSSQLGVNQTPPSILPENIIPFSNQPQLLNIQQNPSQQPSQIQNMGQKNISPSGSQLNSNQQISQAQSNQTIFPAQNVNGIGFGQNNNAYGQAAYHQQTQANQFQGQQPSIMNMGNALNPLGQNNSALPESNQQNFSQNQQQLSILPVEHQKLQVNTAQKQQEQSSDANLSYQNQQQQLHQQNQMQSQAARQDNQFYPAVSESPLITGAKKQFYPADSQPQFNGPQFSAMTSEPSVQRQKISTNEGFVPLLNDGNAQMPTPNQYTNDTALNSEKNPVQSYNISEHQQTQQNQQNNKFPILDTDYKVLPITNQVDQQNNQVQTPVVNNDFYKRNIKEKVPNMFLKQYNENSNQKEEENIQRQIFELQQKQLLLQQKRQNNPQTNAAAGHIQSNFAGIEQSVTENQKFENNAQFQNQSSQSKQMNNSQLNQIPQQQYCNQYNVAQVNMGQMPQGQAPQYQQQLQ